MTALPRLNPLIVAPPITAIPRVRLTAGHAGFQPASQTGVPRDSLAIASETAQMADSA